MYKSVHALTWVVRDVDKAVAGWTKLGFKGIRVLENVTLTDVQYRGKPAACRAKAAEGYLGDVSVQWIQPLDGCGAYADFLARHGDGVFSLVHQAPTREGIQAEIARMNALGIGVLQSETVRAGRGTALRTYLDTEPEGKYVLGLVHYSDGAAPAAAPPGRKVARYAFTVRQLEPVLDFWGRLGFVEKSVTHPPLWDLKYHDWPGQFDAELGWQRHGRVVVRMDTSAEGTHRLRGPYGPARRRGPSHCLRGLGPRRGSRALERPRVPVRPGRRVGREREARLGTICVSGHAPNRRSGRRAPLELPGEEVSNLKRAALACMALLVSGDFGGRFAFSASAGAQVDFVARLTAADVAKLAVKGASVHQDPASKALTFTFDYLKGEPEVRIPVRELGWPTDWRAWRSIQYTFVTTSVETVSIGFSDGKATKVFITEPLSGIRIAGVIPFESFVQTRTMNPLLPLGYKVWLNRLFTFERVEEIVFTMRYPSQPSQLTLYNFTLRDDVPADDIIDRKPLIDQYGQWIPENWPGKAHDERGPAGALGGRHVETGRLRILPHGRRQVPHASQDRVLPRWRNSTAAG